MAARSSRSTRCGLPRTASTDRCRVGLRPGTASTRWEGPLGETEKRRVLSSTLGATQLDLLSDLGPGPLVQVMSTSAYQLGWQYLHPDARWGGSNFHSRLDVANQAWADARPLAFGRLLAGSSDAPGATAAPLTHPAARDRSAPMTRLAGPSPAAMPVPVPTGDGQARAASESLRDWPS